MISWQIYEVLQSGLGVVLLVTLVALVLRIVLALVSKRWVEHTSEFILNCLLISFGLGVTYFVLEGIKYVTSKSIYLP